MIMVRAKVAIEVWAIEGPNFQSSKTLYNGPVGLRCVEVLKQVLHT